MEQTRKSLSHSWHSLANGRFTASLLMILTCLSPTIALSNNLAEKPAKPVKLMMVEHENAGIKRTFFGRVSARQTVDLAFQVGGQIVDFPAIEGEFIAKDSLVARLDLEPFNLALDRATASRQQAQRSLERFERLKANASRAQVDDARTAVTLASIATRDAQYGLERATLNAPFDAIVASRTLANFSTVAAGTPLVRLHDMSELRIEIDVPEILFQRIGDNPNVELNARFPASDKVFPLEYRELNAEASRIGQTFRVTLGMAPPEGLRLLPGASVSVEATLLDSEVGIIVPVTALYKDADGTLSVMRFDGNNDTGKVVKTPVKIEIDGRGYIRVVEGLTAGNEIIVTGVDGLTDGQQVRHFTSF